MRWGFAVIFIALCGVSVPPGAVESAEINVMRHRVYPPLAVNDESRIEFMRVASTGNEMIARARQACTRAFGGSSSLLSFNEAKGIAICSDKSVRKTVKVSGASTKKKARDSQKVTIETPDAVEVIPNASKNQSNPPKNFPENQGGTTASGSGFLISKRGHVVTNAHVVSECKSIRAKLHHGTFALANLITAREDMDLALLVVPSLIDKQYAKIRPSGSVVIGDDAIAFGFPLVGALSSDGSLTTGGISSLSGFRNDRTNFQISVPVQPGNSGGPLLDRNGAVIGVVVAKLNAVEIAKLTGDIPQNVNFAVKSNELLNFLNWVGSEYDLATQQKPLTNAEIGVQAQQYTVMLECSR